MSTLYDMLSQPIAVCVIFSIIYLFLLIERKIYCKIKKNYNSENEHDIELIYTIIYIVSLCILFFITNFFKHYLISWIMVLIISFIISNKNNKIYAEISIYNLKEEEKSRIFILKLIKIVTITVIFLLFLSSIFFKILGYLAIALIVLFTSSIPG